MKPELLNYDVFPKIVLSEKQTRISIVPLFDHSRFAPGKTYEVTCTPMEYTGVKDDWNEKVAFKLKAENGMMRFSYVFDGEQEHNITLHEIDVKNRKKIGDFRFYSLKKDLYSLRPYKGDFHIHSFRSDGMESPAYVAAAGRRIGLDFIAVTDHGLYEPSLEAIESFNNVQIDLAIFPGEEIHPPDNPVHMINFGGKASINACFSERSYRDEVEKLMKDLGDLPAGVDPYIYSSCLWCFHKIKEFGGLSIFCHPYWVYENRYHIPGPLTSYLFRQKPFDAYELIGGFHLDETESNILQVTHYNEERSKGRSIPIVGVSDAHGCERGELFGWYYTVLLSRSLNLSDIIEAVRNQYSVAVEDLPSQGIRTHGPFRIVKYSQFLLREYFPLMDRLVETEGRLMINFLVGDPAVREKLAVLSGTSARRSDHLFGRVSSR